MSDPIPSSASDETAFSPVISPTSTIPVDPTSEVIPPTHTHRTLVICFDGTGDQFDTANSNIIQLFSMLKKDDPTQQMVYYQAGIGTYTIPDIASPWHAKLSKTIDMMVGNHLDAHVMGGYEFLMQNYQAGDKICIFGFSRGAYTARALAGMIHKVGLLPRCNHQQVPFAYKMFTKDDDLGWRQSTAFKKAFSINVDIEFVGVWDTVSSVGIIPYVLPFTKSNNSIRYFRHALSLDERRVRFKPNFYHRLTPADLARGVQRHEMPRSIKRIQVPPLPDVFKLGTEDGHPQQPSSAQLEAAYSDNPISETDVEEVWFAGTHGDVGGGCVPNGTRNSLARIPLRWMIRQCFLAKTGIQFYRSTFQQIGMDYHTVHPEVKPRPVPIYQTRSSGPVQAPPQVFDAPGIVDDCGFGFVSEEHEDLADALCPLFDQLKIALGWWVLELTPQPMRSQQDEDDKWRDGWIVNRGAGRRVPRQHVDGVKIKLHRTVKIRIGAEGIGGSKYVPNARLEVEPEWVD